MKDLCAKLLGSPGQPCLDPRGSTIHMTESTNWEIRHGAHEFLPMDVLQTARIEFDKHSVVLIRWLTSDEDEVSDETMIEVAERAREAAVTMGLMK